MSKNKSKNNKPKSEVAEVKSESEVSEISNQNEVSEVESLETENKNASENKKVDEKKSEDKKNNVKDKKKDKKEKGQNKIAKKTKETFSELKKVSWPTFGQVVKKKGGVLAVVIMFREVLFGIDYLLGLLFDLLTSGIPQG